MNKIQIRQCISEDVGLLEKLFFVLYKPELKWNRQKLQEDIEKGRKIYYLALIEKEAAGAFGIKFDTSGAKFGPLVVRESYRHGMIGSELLKYAENLARKRDSKRIWCTSLARYGVAKFYLQNGWREASSMKDFYDGQDCFIYEKDLT